MRLQGQLERDSLPNLLQYLSMSTATGVLRLSSGGRTAEVFLDRGALVHAAAGTSQGTEALRQLLRLSRGTFWFETGVAAPRRTVSSPLNALLLELAYETDVEDLRRPEGGALAADTILVPASARDGRTGNLTLPLTAIRALPLLNDGLRISELAGRLGVEVEEMLAAADVIIRSGLAEVRSAAEVGPALLEGITSVLRDIMGPLAEIVLDEVLFELDLSAGGIPEARLPELLERLAAAAEAERPGVERMLRQRFRSLKVPAAASGEN